MVLLIVILAMNTFVIAFTFAFFLIGQCNKTCKRKKNVRNDISEEQRELRRRAEGFNNIMNYDIDVALGNKVQRGDR